VQIKSKDHSPLEWFSLKLNISNGKYPPNALSKLTVDPTGSFMYYVTLNTTNNISFDLNNLTLILESIDGITYLTSNDVLTPQILPLTLLQLPTGLHYETDQLYLTTNSTQLAYINPIVPAGQNLTIKDLMNATDFTDILSIKSVS
jgi:hypothetical protein